MEEQRQYLEPLPPILENLSWDKKLELAELLIKSVRTSEALPSIESFFEESISKMSAKETIEEISGKLSN